MAEILIVLVVIGVITAILLPVAIQGSPDENVMKFKKGNTTLNNIVRSLVNDDKYYTPGDFGKKPDGSLVNSPEYFCRTFSDMVSTSSVTCSDADEGVDNAHLHLVVINGVNNTQERKQFADTVCKQYQKDGIVTSDGITYYEVSPYHHFAVNYKDTATRLFGNPGVWNNAVDYDENGNVSNTKADSSFDLIYKVFCMDVDGINKGEDPFGYGIRADGKILTGARADLWIEKSARESE